MIKLTEEQISDIAQDLEAGLKCFIHKVTGEVKTLPDELNGNMEIDEELWQDVIDEIDNDEENFIVIEGMDSRESYILMEKFIDTVEDKQIAARLTNAINVPKPFHTFRYELDYSDEYLKKWYAFKSQQMIEWVKKHLLLNSGNENEEEEEM
ncbi:MAG: hypothetical protein IPG09_04660 [Ignavibacteria bacterium]|nr:hypothetical protein [Ignavibacteria bacterium]MBK7447415.1 hypothetical protein [Ignavibacteria bacterium]